MMMLKSSIRARDETHCSVNCPFLGTKCRFFDITIDQEKNGIPIRLGVCQATVNNMGGKAVSFEVINGGKKRDVK